VAAGVVRAFSNALIDMGRVTHATTILLEKELSAYFNERKSK